MVFIFLVFLPEPFVRIFTSDPELIESSCHAIKRIFFVIYISGFLMIGSIIFQSIGKPVQSFVLAIAKSVIFLIPAILIFPRFFKVEGVWLAFPVTDVLTFLLTILLLTPLIRELRAAPG